MKLLDHEWHGRDARDADGASWGDIFALLGPTGRSGVRDMIDHPPDTLLGWLCETRLSYLVTTPVMAQRLVRWPRAGPGRRSARS